MIHAHGGDEMCPARVLAEVSIQLHLACASAVPRPFGIASENLIVSAIQPPYYSLQIHKGRLRVIYGCDYAKSMILRPLCTYWLDSHPMFLHGAQTPFVVGPDADR